MRISWIGGGRRRRDRSPTAGTRRGLSPHAGPQKHAGADPLCNYWRIWRLARRRADPYILIENFQVQTLLQNMQDKFQTMSDQIITRIDEMGNRIDDLEKNIADLMTQAGVDGSEKWVEDRFHSEFFIFDVIFLDVHVNDVVPGTARYCWVSSYSFFVPKLILYSNIFDYLKLFSSHRYITM